MVRIHGSYSRENERLEKLLIDGKKGIRTAKRKLKYPCSICGKPITKGQTYIYKKRFICFGWIVKYIHVDCLEEVDSDG